MAQQPKDKGATGARGATGAKGNQGNRGNPGVAGSTGPQGDTGIDPHVEALLQELIGEVGTLSARVQRETQVREGKLKEIQQGQAALHDANVDNAKTRKRQWWAISLVLLVFCLGFINRQQQNQHQCDTAQENRDLIGNVTREQAKPDPNVFAILEQIPSFRALDPASKAFWKDIANFASLEIERPGDSDSDNVPDKIEKLLDEPVCEGVNTDVPWVPIAVIVGIPVVWLIGKRVQEHKRK